MVQKLKSKPKTKSKQNTTRKPQTLFVTLTNLEQVNVKLSSNHMSLVYTQSSETKPDKRIDLLIDKDVIYDLYHQCFKHDLSLSRNK